MAPRPLELLAPAADKHVARQAILHGADAVYMGASSHGARKKAANSLEDIRETVDLAHIYRAKVYVTVNTLVYENELEQVRRLVSDLYRIGVDGIIVQDMALLEMDIPPISLHASTQCDTRTVEKARYLECAGFSQIVLARELSLKEIREICSAVTVPVECFVHGALCVSYSGRCAASQYCVGRSANRGECAQMCRMPYTLSNGRGEVLMRDKYLLSLRDFNTLSRLPELVDAGVSSFKIEGRLKDATYVKNVTAAYRRALDAIIASHPDRYCRASYGTSQITFTPQLDKSFNRGFTDYFLDGRHPGSMASLDTPKSMGERIESVSRLRNGDGISFFNANGEYEGVSVNGIQGNRIIGSRKVQIPNGSAIYRTFDHDFQAQLSRNTAERKLALDISIDERGVSATDERGLTVRLALDCERFEAERPMDPKPVFAKLGATEYCLRNFENHLNPSTFIPASQLTALRRRLTDALSRVNLATYPYEYRRREGEGCRYPETHLDVRSNVANHIAAEHYRRHGVTDMERALEVGGELDADRVVMTTRYCLRRELGCCLRDCKDAKKRARFEPPLSITTGANRFELQFDCQRCEMSVVAADTESAGSVSAAAKGCAKR